MNIRRGSLQINYRLTSSNSIFAPTTFCVGEKDALLQSRRGGGSLLKGVVPVGSTRQPVGPRAARDSFGDFFQNTQYFGV